MRTKQFFLAVAMAAIASSVAFAADEGVYVGGGVGQSKVKDPGCENGPGITFTSCGSTDNGVKVFVGYQFTKHWGAEVSYVDFGKIKATARVGGQPANLQIKSHGFQLAEVGTLPLNNKVSIFGKAGVFLAHVDSSGTGNGTNVSLSGNSTTFSYGVGAKFDISERIALRAEFEVFKKIGDDSTTGTSDVSLISVGARYKF